MLLDQTMRTEANVHAIVLGMQWPPLSSKADRRTLRCAHIHKDQLWESAIPGSGILSITLLETPKCLKKEFHGYRLTFILEIYTA